MKADTLKRDANPATDALCTQLASLHLSSILEHYESLASVAAEKQWPHVEYLAQLIEGEAHRREERSIARRISLARFPVIKTLDQFQWSWPRKINRLQVQNLFRLTFIEEKANVIFLANVGLGKSHLSIALGHTACPPRSISSTPSAPPRCTAA
jgi:DNA replication protein DnaC